MPAAGALELHVEARASTPRSPRSQDGDVKALVVELRILQPTAGNGSCPCGLAAVPLRHPAGARMRSTGSVSGNGACSPRTRSRWTGRRLSRSSHCGYRSGSRPACCLSVAGSCTKPRPRKRLQPETRHWFWGGLRSWAGDVRRHPGVWPPTAAAASSPGQPVLLARHSSACGVSVNSTRCSPAKRSSAVRTSAGVT